MKAAGGDVKGGRQRRAQKRYGNVKRCLDAAAALGALLALFPVFLFAAAGIRLSSEGPILFRAERMGKGGVPFIMYKFRTMEEGTRTEKGRRKKEAGAEGAGRKETGHGGRITSADDPRVFPFGGFLRKAKIDELPQLVNILKGDMAVIGPRPEDVSIVKTHYTKRQMHTLDVLPGLAGPGSLFLYTHGEALLKGSHAEQAYIERLLPVKLEMDLYYVRHASLRYDAGLILRTMAVIAARMCGVKRFGYPAEYRVVRGCQEKKRQTPEDIQAYACRKRCQGDKTG